MQATIQNFFTDHEDLQWHFSRLDWASLVPLTEESWQDEDSFTDIYQAKETYREILVALGDFIAAEIAPYASELDQQNPTYQAQENRVIDPPRMKKIMQGLGEMGAFGLSIPRKLGGMGAPFAVQMIFLEMLARADVSVMTYFSFHSGIAQSMLLYSLDEGSYTAKNGILETTRFDRQIRSLAAGDVCGAMVLTEPHAGSDLSQLRTMATLQDDGTWQISGQKIFITAGHREYHIVIARSEPEEGNTAGLAGLSLFYVPKKKPITANDQDKYAYKHARKYKSDNLHQPSPASSSSPQSSPTPPPQPAPTSSISTSDNSKNSAPNILSFDNPNISPNTNSNISPNTNPNINSNINLGTPSAPDSDGPNAPDNFIIGGIEHKMGQHSNTVATIYYENSYAELIGKRGQGFQNMLLLMNNARILVGFEGTGLCESAFRMATQYAEERTSMGQTISRHPMIADMLDDMEMTIRALRAVSFDAAFHEEMATRLQVSRKLSNTLLVPWSEEKKKRVDAAIMRHKKRSRYLTPLLKYMSGEETVRITRLNLQIHGGLGYIIETGAEKLVRDSLIIPIYEGTSQIQALMALKDHMQTIMRNPGQFLSEVASSRLDALRAKDPLERQLARMKGVAHTALQTIASRITADKLGNIAALPLTAWKEAAQSPWEPNRDFHFGLLHAERLTRILAAVAAAECLWRQAQAAAETPHAAERRALAERWMERAEPRIRGIGGEIEATGGSLLGRLLAKRRRA